MFFIILSPKRATRFSFQFSLFDSPFLGYFSSIKVTVCVSVVSCWLDPRVASADVFSFSSRVSWIFAICFIYFLFLSSCLSLRKFDFSVPFKSTFGTDDFCFVKQIFSNTKYVGHNSLILVYLRWILLINFSLLILYVENLHSSRCQGVFLNTLRHFVEHYQSHILLFL